MDIDVMRVEVVRDVAFLARPCLEGLELAPEYENLVSYQPAPEKAEFLLRLAHIRVEVVEVSQFCGPEARIRVSRVEPLVVLHVDEDIVLACSLEQLLVVFQELDRWFRDEDVVPFLYRVQSNRVVRGVRGKDSDLPILAGKDPDDVM